MGCTAVTPEDSVTPSDQPHQDTPWHSPAPTTCFCWNVMTHLSVCTMLDPGPPKPLQGQGSLPGPFRQTPRNGTWHPAL